MRRSSLQKADDTELIAGAAKGDREAFGALYERYVFKVFRHVYYLTGNLHTAEDLTAQTFLKALEAIHRYEMRGVPFLAWLLRIAYNLTVNHRKVRAKSVGAVRVIQYRALCALRRRLEDDLGHHYAKSRAG